MPEDRRIVLLGRPRAGKTSSGNTILGSDQFTSRGGCNAVTSECVSKSAEVEGRRVTLVDTPGFTDEVLTPEQLFTEIKKSIAEASPGPHAFVIVVRIGRISEEDVTLFEIFEKLFSNDASKYFMVLFTHGDDLEGENIVDLIQSNKSVSKLVSLCGGRFCVFDNKAKNGQVSEFLNAIDEMVKANPGEHFTEQMIRMVETSIREERKCSESSTESKPLEVATTALGRRLQELFQRLWKFVCTFFCGNDVFPV